MNLVTPDILTLFLQKLSRCYRASGRVYLVGGSSLILTAAKQSTLDIDLQIDVDAEHHGAFIRCLRQVSREMIISVELAAPDQFIPLPKGYKDRHQFIDRYGQLDIFHYDFYSIALSKIQRGNSKDFDDVSSMLTNSIIDLVQLAAYFEEILPQVDEFGLRASSADFTRKFNLLKQRIE